jgi:hypothetical protein
MRYLVGTLEYGIHYSSFPAVLEGYSDANWISDLDELYALVDTFSLLAVLLFLGDHANRRS